MTNYPIKWYYNIKKLPQNGNSLRSVKNKQN